MLPWIHGTVALALLTASGLFAQDGPILQTQNRFDDRPVRTSPHAARASDGFILPPAPGELDAAGREASDPPSPELPPELPADSAEPMLDPNRQNYLGVITDPLPDSLVAQFADTLGDSAGLLVRSVRPGSAAERAGLQPNDILTAYNGEALSSSDDLKRLVVTDEPGATVELSIIRAAQPQTLTVSLGQRTIPAPAAREPRRIIAAPLDRRPPPVDIRLPGGRSIIVDRNAVVTPWIAVEWGSPLAGRRFRALTPDGRQFEVEVRAHPEAWSPRHR